MLTLLFLAAAFAIAILRLSVYPRRKWMAAYAAAHLSIFLLLSVTWLASDYFTGEGFNEAVNYHLRVGLEGAGFMEYLGIALISVVLLIAAIIVSWRVARFLLKGAGVHNSAVAVFCLVAFPFLCLFHPTVNGFLNGFNAALYGPGSVAARWLSTKTLHFGESADFDDFYIEPKVSWNGNPPRNLVMLYVESLEMSYFDEERFPGLISELRTLEKEAIRFTDYRQLHGSGFTMGGIVASQCGLPLVTSGHPNSMRGMDEFMPDAICLGDVLSTRGYSLHYMGGAQLSFAGKGKFFDTHAFDSVSGLEALQPMLDDPGYVSSWGLFDDSLLQQFKARFEELSRAGSPFALVGLTMDTHHPNGHHSQSCDGYEYGDGSNRMLNAVKCADRLVSETIKNIRDSEWGKDTVLVVASDHLALKNSVLDRLSSGPRRNLLWVFPAGEYEPRAIDKLGSSLDTAATVVDFLGSTSSAFGLGRSMVSEAPSLESEIPHANWQIREWRNKLKKFWSFPEWIDSLEIDGENLLINVNGKPYKAPALLQIEDGALGSAQFEFDSNLTLDSFVREADEDQLFAWVDDCRRIRAMSLALPEHGYCAFVGKPGGEETLAAEMDKNISLNTAELHRFSTSPTVESIARWRQDNLAAYQQHGTAGIRRFAVQLDGVSPDGKLKIRSSGGPKKISEVDDGAQNRRLNRGIHLLAIDHDLRIEPVAHYDACAENQAPPPPISRVISEAGRDFRAFLLVAHDSATCGEPLDPIFEGLALKEWRNLDLRQPYVAVLPSAGVNGSPWEAIAGPYVSLFVDVLPGNQHNETSSGEE